VLLLLLLLRQPSEREAIKVIYHQHGSKRAAEEWQ